MKQGNTVDWNSWNQEYVSSCGPDSHQQKSAKARVRWCPRFHYGHTCVPVSLVSCCFWKTFLPLPSPCCKGEHWKVKVKNTWESLGLIGSDWVIWEQASYFISSGSSSNKYLWVVWESQRKYGEQKKKTNNYMQGKNCAFRNYWSQA